MKPKLTWLLVGAFAVSTSSLMNCPLADEFNFLEANEEQNRNIDTWVQRFDNVRPQDIDAEFDDLNRAFEGVFGDFRRIVAARLIRKGSHAQKAASFLLDQVGHRI